MSLSEKLKTATEDSDVMQQGRRYEEVEPSGYTSPVNPPERRAVYSNEESVIVANEDTINSTVLDGTAPASEDVEYDEGRNWLSSKVIIIGVVVIVLLVVAAGIFGFMKHKEKQEAADEAYLASMESADKGFKYSSDEVQELRAQGYTGDEIENYELEEFSYKQLVEQAEFKRKEYIDKELAPVYNAASPQYKELEQKTWVGGPDLKFSTNADAYEYLEYTLNADFIKITPKNHQLFLRITLGDGTHAFFTVSPERYIELPESGNIVVRICYTNTSDNKVITSIEEVIPE